MKPKNKLTIAIATAMLAALCVAALYAQGQNKKSTR